MKIVFIALLFSLAGTLDAQQKLVINFNFNTSRITPVAKQKLDSLIHAISSSVQKIDLYGHCDAVGGNSYNDNLSVRRVTAVKDYLTANSISEDVFDTLKGFGKRRPLSDNSTPKERYLNRRVEIFIKMKSLTQVQDAKKDMPVPQEQTLTEKIKDTTTKKGSNIILKNMNFIGGRHYLLEQSLPALTELLNALADNPSLEIEIDGHICCTFGNEDGIDLDTNTPDLSVNRAKAIYEYLISKGISPARLSYKGFGHRQPLVYPEDTEDKRTMNRRVEIKIVKK